MDPLPCTDLQIRSIYKSFGSKAVLKGIDVDVKHGEFVTLLGPSGCGKTTLLRIIGGFEKADSGEVLLNGQVISNRSPSKRPINTVFQNYALFPHLNIFGNVAFGLKSQKVPKDEIERRVNAMLELVNIADLAKEMPSTLSGGQKQRAALARALVNEPEILLLDEPLGALDAFTRMHIQDELLDIKNTQKTSVLMITHDIDEAVYLSDYVIVMTPRPGRVAQIIEVGMEHPRNRSDEKFVKRRNEILEILHFAKSK